VTSPLLFVATEQFVSRSKHFFLRDRYFSPRHGASRTLKRQALAAMHSLICDARTVSPGAGVNRASSSLTHERSQKSRRTTSSSDRGSDEFFATGLHCAMITVPRDRSSRVSSAAVALYGVTELHAESSAAASSPSMHPKDVVRTVLIFDSGPFKRCATRLPRLVCEVVS
jgi:hypothetical protein